VLIKPRLSEGHVEGHHDGEGGEVGAAAFCLERFSEWMSHYEEEGFSNNDLMPLQPCLFGLFE
jgi:hypothetical protein